MRGGQRRGAAGTAVPGAAGGGRSAPASPEPRWAPPAGSPAPCDGGTKLIHPSRDSAGVKPEGDAARPPLQPVRARSSPRLLQGDRAGGQCAPGPRPGGSPGGNALHADLLTSDGAGRAVPGAPGAAGSVPAASRQAEPGAPPETAAGAPGSLVVPLTA